MAVKETRPVRMCDLCGGVDDHPRHVFAHATGDAPTDVEVGMKALDAAPDAPAKSAVMAHIRDTSTSMRHMDCCREAGCPDGTCDQVTAGAENKRGMDLVKHIQKGGN
jgi:hypothetical protein